MSQLFSETPPLELVKKIINLIIQSNKHNFLIDGLQITRLQITNEVINNFKIIYIQILKKYYYKCKAKIYLNTITPQRFITILRQIVRPYNIIINSKEKYGNGKKYLMYTFKNKNEPTYNLTINFD